ncbi:hypothetical protein B0H13DRAFT_2336142 [Mycena leptocephala]|nr:hypothetical protein B0H13DRAFT_2336142 [Mycena leptocephala]
MADQVIRKVQNVRASDTTNDEASATTIYVLRVCAPAMSASDPTESATYRRGKIHHIDYAPIDLD